MDNHNHSANEESDNNEIDFAFSYQEDDADYLCFDDENGFVHKVRCVAQNHTNSTEQSLGTPVLGSYVIKEEILGEGGQGIVFRSADPFIAVKLAQEGKKDIKDPKKIEEFKNQMKALIFLQLPKDLNVSLPYAVLNNHAGYVMRLLNTAEPIGKSLMSDSNRPAVYAGQNVIDSLKKHDSLKFIILDGRLEEIRDSADKVCAKPLIRYTVSGGARLRSEALSKTAAILARLHGRGLVYGDISANNVFLAADNDERCTVWLIDADNLEYEKKRGMTVYTPSYGAPELVQRVDGVRFVSDCHAFGVLVSRVLTWVHPFYGQLLEDPDEDNWEDPNSSEMTMEQKANAGLLPWIDDPDDSSNIETHLSKMLPRNVFLTEYLRRIFKVTFCEGRINPSLRPTMVHWCKSLIQERDITLKCSKCGMSIPYQNDSVKCICCDQEPLAPYILELKAYRFLPQGRMASPEWIWKHELNINSEEKKSELEESASTENTLEKQSVSEKLEFSLPERIFKPFNIHTFDDEFMKVKYVPSKLQIKNSVSGYFRFSCSAEADCAVYYADPGDGRSFVRLRSNGRIIDAEVLLQGVSLICMTKFGYARLIAVTLKRC